jgi:phenylpropionate dioxygenase-like ring-hydroxylating dioxygenase large terminal subunit
MSVRSYIVDVDRRRSGSCSIASPGVGGRPAHGAGANLRPLLIYVGHSSELKKPGDFRSRKVAGRPVIFCRDQAGQFHCLFNTCRHRSAIICTEREGNRRRFQCIYHGWTYGTTAVSSAWAPTPMPSFDKSSHGLRRPAGSEVSRLLGSCVSTRTPIRYPTIWRAPRTTSISSSIQSPSGQMEIIAGVQEYDVAANWKLMVENSVDDYTCPRPIRPGSTSWPIRA